MWCVVNAVTYVDLAIYVFCTNKEKNVVNNVYTVVLNKQCNIVFLIPIRIFVRVVIKTMHYVYVYACVRAGVFITSFYVLLLLIMLILNKQ